MLFRSTTGDNVFLKVTQHPSNTATTTATHISATPNNYASVLTRDGNKWVATFQATNAAQYLRMAIRAAAGVKLKWSLIPLATGNAAWQPVGITQAQCAAVSSLGSTSGSLFADNTLVHYFEEFRFFEKVTSQTRYGKAFFERAKFPPYLQSIDYYTATWGYLPIIDFPNTLESIVQRFWRSLQPNPDRVLILRSEVPPTVGNSYFDARKVGTLYIPAAYRSAYESHEVWGQLSAKMANVEGSPYEVFNEWDWE